MRCVRFTKAVVAVILALIFVTAPVSMLYNGVAYSAPNMSRFFVYFPLYLQSGIHLMPVEYLVPATATPAREAVEALIAGLPDYLVESSGMMIVPLPKQTKVLNINVEYGMCTVDFSGDIRNVSVGSGGEAALLNAIVETLCQFQGIDSVRILIDGMPADSLAGHVDITQPRGRSESDSKWFMTFPDALQHWGGGAIAALQVSDVVGGYPDNTFKPDRNLTRAEFVKMLVETANLPYSTGGHESFPFKDVVDHWCRPYIERALAAGIVSSEDYGYTFKPDEALPREEACYLLIKCSDIYLANHPELILEPREAGIGFRDVSSIQKKYLASITECVERGFIEGYPDGTFRPDGTLTRAEACAILTRMQGIQGEKVLLLGPKPGFKWDGSSVFVMGFATAFEANVNWRARTGSGADVIKQNYTTSTYGIGWGAFGLCIDHRLLQADEPIAIEIYLIDMKDGGEYSLVRVPLAK